MPDRLVELPPAHRESIAWLSGVTPRTEAQLPPDLDRGVVATPLAFRRSGWATWWTVDAMSVQG